MKSYEICTRYLVDSQLLKNIEIPDEAFEVVVDSQSNKQKEYVIRLMIQIKTLNRMDAKLVE